MTRIKFYRLLRRLSMSVVYLWLECFDVLCYFFTKYEHADQVRDCHERICYIRKAPYKIKCLCAAKFKNASAFLLRGGSHLPADIQPKKRALCKTCYICVFQVNIQMLFLHDIPIRGL